MATRVEQRYEDCGFIYTDRTRMMFAPKFTVTRNPDDNQGPPHEIVLCAALNCAAEPTQRDVAECREILITMYPNRRIYADAAGGLVPIYDGNAVSGKREPLDKFPE